MATAHYPMADAVRAAYRAGQEDETLEPLVRVDGAGRPVGRIRDGDYVIFYDIRGGGRYTTSALSPAISPLTSRP